MKIQEIIGALEQFAPLALQDGYDNAGLQIGLTEDADASGALLCLDVTEDIIDEAIRRGCNLIVSHHPLLFRSPKTITGKDYVERCIMKAIKNDVAIYSAHTNLDNARGGVNFMIADKLGANVDGWLDPKQGVDAGAGVICSLPEPLSREEFVALVKRTFCPTGSVRYNSWQGTEVQRIAVCGGAGAFLLPNAVAAGADAFITGEVGYHRFFGHEADILLMEIGHYESEQFTIATLRRVISGAFPTLPLYDTEVVTNPIHYM